MTISKFSKYYDSDIATNKKVELVMMNGDQDKSDAVRWAKKHKFNFPVIMLNELNRKSALYKYYSGSFPNYVLIDKSGKVITRGASQSKAKIKNL